MKNTIFTLLFSFLFFWANAQANLVITAVYDGPLTGGVPKGIEVYAINDIADLSVYALASANNGSGVDTIEYTFPALAVTAGSYLYIASDSIGFNDYFGFFPNFRTSAMSINGNDAILLFGNGTIIDVFGDININGSGTAWDYLDGWAARKSGTGPDGNTFVLDNWIYSGIDALDNETTNATAANPVPIGVYVAELPADVQVVASGLLFTPADITINAGDKVEWMNTAGVHNVNGSIATFPANPEDFFSGAPATAPWTYSYTFNTPGIYNYQCDLHAGAGMVGTVTVLVPLPAYDIGVVTTDDVNGESDSLGVVCELTGVVYGNDFNGGGGLSFTIIDATGGINVFSSGSFGYTVAEGDMITVQGTIAAFRGLTEIIPDTLWMVSAGNTLADPAVVTTLDATTESELVRMNNMTLADPAQWTNAGSGFNATITDGTNNFTMRVDADVDLFGTPAPTGFFDVIGIGGQFDSSSPYTDGYQLFPRYQADIIPIIPPVITANADMVNTDVNTDVTIDVIGNDQFPFGIDTIYINTDPTSGMAVINMDTSITYTPNMDFCGTDFFTYVICDTTGTCDTAMVDISIICPPSYPMYGIGTIATVDANGELDSLGVSCEVRGIVYGVNQRPAGLQFTVIDKNNADDGIGVFNLNGNYGYTVQEGDEIAIQGVVGFFNGLAQMNTDSVWLLSSNNPLFDPEVITTLGENAESKLVKIENLTIVDPAQWTNTGSGFNVDVTNGTTTFAMRIDNDVDIYGTAVPTLSFNLTGIGGQFDSSSPYDEGYQILPRYLSDLDFISSVPNPILDNKIAVFPNPVQDQVSINREVPVQSIELINVFGQAIIQIDRPEESIQLDLSGVPAGIYFLTFHTEDGIWTKELIKQ